MPNKEQKLGWIPSDEEIQPYIELEKQALQAEGLSSEKAEKIAKDLIENRRDRIRQATTRLLAEKAATIDGLTQINNRRAFDEEFHREFERTNRSEADLSVVLIDMDKFKQINDALGHAMGDEALKLLARIVKNHKRETDFVARYGGEEFIIILPKTDIVQAAIFSEKLRNIVQSEFKKELTQNHPEKSQEIEKLAGTISLGVAAYKGENTPQTQIKEGHLLEAADQCLYRAKHDGRNCFRVTEAGGEKPAIETVKKELNHSVEGRDNIIRAFEASGG